MSTNEAEQIPLTVIGGFLGAGKTTYLNNLIKRGLPANALLVVNDFGDINIDAELVEYRDDNIMQLSNGCVCCTLGGTLAEQLAAALRIRSTPAAIIIEASGVANPARIADIAKLSPRLRLDEVVCIVDGSQAPHHAQDSLIGDTWRIQVASANRVYINRLTASDKPAVFELLKHINPEAFIEYAPLASSSSLEAHSSASQPRTAHGNFSSHPHANWHSFSVTGSASIDKNKLNTLLDSYRDVLLRAKGFMLVNDGVGVELLQYSGGQLYWQPALRPPIENRLVFIGIAGPRFDALKQAADALVKPSLSS
ncbi:CobW family GTP-binding protein [Halomonas sp. M20]|uniref:CobW family GTP-binding protein n=1 Tax=Halomonas sp. M20 TaxID=2763264 RepID=UPI001D0A03C2|nr:GTP-binding protein [Halomonas sp. M20]